MEWGFYLAYNSKEVTGNSFFLLGHCCIMSVQIVSKEQEQIERTLLKGKFYATWQKLKPTTELSSSLVSVISHTAHAK